MAWTQGDLDALKEAYATGTLLVRMPDGRELTRTSLKAVQDQIAVLERRIDAGQAVPLARGRARRFVNMSR